MPGAFQILIIVLHGRHYDLAPSQVNKLDFGFGLICNPKPALFPLQSSSRVRSLQPAPRRHSLPLREPLPGRRGRIGSMASAVAPSPRASAAQRPSPSLKLYTGEAGRKFIKMKTIKTPQTGTASPLRGLQNNKDDEVKKRREFFLSPLIEQSPKEKASPGREPSRGTSLGCSHAPRPQSPRTRRDPRRNARQPALSHAAQGDTDRAGSSAARERPGRGGTERPRGPRYLVLIKASQLLRAHVFVTSHDDPNTERPLSSHCPRQGAETPALARQG